MPGTLYLVRCPDTGNTATSGRVHGWTNVPLTAEGKKQSLSVGQSLQGGAYTCLYTSDLLRATTSAALIAETAEVGQTESSSVWRGWDKPSKGNTGESFEEFSQRVLSPLQSILQDVAQAGVSHLLVTHDTTVQLILAWVAGGAQGPQVDPGFFGRQKLTGNLATLNFDGEKWSSADQAPVSPTKPRGLPPCAKDANARQNLGNKLRNDIAAGLVSREGSQEWWNTCMEFHRNEMSESSSPGEGLVPFHVPVSQPRQDSLTANVCSVIGKQNPYMLAESAAGKSGVEDLKEKVVHRFWHRAGFERAIRKASSVCTDTNLCWYRIAWDRTTKKPYSGLILDVIPPWNTVVFPASDSGISGSRLVGHRFYRSQKEIAILQKGGTYFDDVSVPGGAQPTNVVTANAIRDAGVNIDSVSQDNGDLRVECWQVIFRWSEGASEPEQTYIATVDQTTGTLLTCDFYDYSRPWYFDASYIVEVNEAYYPAVSVARHLSGIQSAYDLLAALVLNGSQIAAMPPVFGQDLPEKDTRYSYGQMIQTDTPADPWSPTLHFDGGPIIQFLEGLAAVADAVARVSNNTMGATQSRPTTATENSIIASGVSVGLEEYIGNFAANLPEAAEFTIELLTAHFHDWQEDAGVMGIKLQDLVQPCNWDVNGTTPGNTPGAKIAAAQGIAQLAAQFGPSTGIDIYELANFVILNSGMGGGDNVQIPKQEFEQQQQAAAQAQQQQMAAQQGQPAQGAQPPPQGAPQVQPGQPPSASSQLSPEQQQQVLQLLGNLHQHLQNSGLGGIQQAQGLAALLGQGQQGGVPVGQ